MSDMNKSNNNLAPYTGPDMGDEVSRHQLDPTMGLPSALKSHDGNDDALKELHSAQTLVNRNINNLVRENKILRKKLTTNDRELHRNARSIDYLENEVSMLKRQVDHLSKIIDNISEHGILVNKSR